MESFLKTHCRDDIPYGYCNIGNICYLFTQLIGFAAILPQIHQIWMYQSVDALHILWPTLLFTSSLTAVFYVFDFEKRAFFKASAVYFPIVYFLFLAEFWIFNKKNPQKRLLFTAVIAIVWACILVVELTVPDGPMKLQWVNVILYSIKILPQLMLNIWLRTTFGQSSISVLLYCLMSSFGYLSICLLEVPLQFQMMYYLSSSLAYMNAIQVLWYPRPTVPKKKTQTYGTMHDPMDYTIPFEEHQKQNEDIELNEHKESENEEMNVDAIVKACSSNETSCVASYGRSQTINVVGYFHRLKEKSCIEIALLIYLCIGLIAFTVGLAVRADTFWTIFGPLSMFAVLFLTSLYRDYNEGSLSCYFFTDMHYRIFGES
ncbi:uncharacterized protein [Clytia hemisphaerica]